MPDVLIHLLDIGSGAFYSRRVRSQKAVRHGDACHSTDSAYAGPNLLKYESTPICVPYSRYLKPDACCTLVGPLLPTGFP